MMESISKASRLLAFLFLGFAMSFVLLGCSVHGIHLSTDKSFYKPTSKVQLLLFNGTLTKVGYNLCFSSLERRVGPEWIPIREEKHGISCHALLHGSGPLSFSKPLNHMLPKYLPAGRYRYTTRVEYLGKSFKLPSDAFTVAGHPEVASFGGHDCKKISIPTQLKFERAPKGIWVSIDKEKMRKIELRCTPGLLLGVRYELVKMKGKKAQFISAGLGGRMDIGRVFLADTSGEKQGGAQGEKIQVTISVFETDVPVQHLWAPASGKLYKVIWSGVLEGNSR